MLFSSKQLNHLTRNSSLWEYMLPQCVIPWKKPQAPEKMSTYFFQPHPPPPLHESILTATARSQSLELINLTPFQKSQLFQKQFEFDPSRKQS